MLLCSQCNERSSTLLSCKCLKNFCLEHRTSKGHNCNVLNQTAAIDYDRENKIIGFPQLGKLWLPYDYLKSIPFGNTWDDHDELIKERLIISEKENLEEIWKQHSKIPFNSEILSGMLSGYNVDDIEGFIQDYRDQTNYISNTKTLKDRLDRHTIKCPEGWYISKKTFKRIHDFLDDVDNIDNIQTDKQGLY